MHTFIAKVEYYNSSFLTVAMGSAMVCTKVCTALVQERIVSVLPL